MRPIVFVTAIVALAGGLLMAVGGSAGTVAGLICLVVAGVAAAEEAFFAVGRSEDRERAREATIRGRRR